MVGEVVRGFKFDPGGIGSIFKAHRLKVPTFQREYAWEADEVNQLFTDLNRAKSENTDHFLGTIVTVRTGSHGQLEIVDGQQRLTTTALLIAAIRDEQINLGQPPKVIESINSEYLGSFDRKYNDTVPKLTLNIDDNDFFSALINGKPTQETRESHRRLASAYREATLFVRKIISTFSDADKSLVLNDWLEFIELGASVILVITDNAAKAFKMFETLNDRGLKTSQADLVKSYLFGESGERIAEAQSRWSSMKENLESVGDEDRAINYLRHVLIATQKFVRTEEIYETVQSTVRGSSNAVAFLTTLESFSSIYVATFASSSDVWLGRPPATVRGLEVFNRFNLKPIRPLVLALANHFSEAEFETAIVFLASLSVRLVITGRTRSGTIETTFAEAAKQVSSKEVTGLSALKVVLAKVIVSDADFKQEFAIARVTNASAARYYLRALEGAQASEKEPWYILNDDPAAMTLEHVLPQNADESWSDLDDDQQKRLVRRLGNLCIMDKTGNGAVANKSFAEKRNVLSKAPYKLTSMIAEYEYWGPEQITERQNKLAELAVRAWPV
jgi:hypothetical protein